MQIDIHRRRNMNFQMDASGQYGTITIDEPLTIENVPEVKTIFLDAYKKTNHVNIRFKSLADIDLNGLQLFCSAHRTFSNAQKIINMDLTNATMFRQRARELGLIRHKGCHLEQSENCLWRQQNK
jgi:anti-anti-sigma regulatory factor